MGLQESCALPLLPRSFHGQSGSSTGSPRARGASCLSSSRGTECSSVALCPGAAPKPSPLRCLENSLKGILPGRPLRFACLAGPSPSPGSSSSSSFSSSEGDELWQLLPQGEPSPPLCCQRGTAQLQGSWPLSLGPGGAPTGSGPGEGPGKAEFGDPCWLRASEPRGSCEGAWILSWPDSCWNSLLWSRLGSCKLSLL